MPGHELLVQRWTTWVETTSLGMSWLRSVGTTLLLNLCRLLSRLVIVVHGQWVERRFRQIWRGRLLSGKVMQGIIFFARWAEWVHVEIVGGGEEAWINGRRLRGRNNDLMRPCVF